jgi:SAM-dependent methyltransferase
MFCHGELNRSKPGDRSLTSFYLMISLGGALGAIFVGLAAPHLFSNLFEFPFTLLFTALLALLILWDQGWANRALWVAVSAAMAIVLSTNVQNFEQSSLVMVRNFYGALRVTQTTEFGNRPARMLYHGTIRHGAQFLDLPWRKQPTTYYGFDSGVGLALRYCCSGPKRVGVIGLGTGTLAAYGQPGDDFHFYEINPDVIRIAQNVFTYLRETPARHEVTLGDARLSLEAEPPQKFDVLAVDAFSGDAIPVHLLTREAVALYLRHLKPNGILAIHTSNSYLALAPVSVQLAHAFGYPAKSILSASDDDECISTANWVLITRNSQFLNLPILTKNEQPVAIPAGLRLWTDDYNNLFQILKPVRFRHGID